jgi:hypothetical protein
MLKRTKLVLAAASVVVIALGVAVVLFAMGGPHPSQFGYLMEPQIRILPNRKVLQVQAPGEPEAVGSQAFGLLFKTYSGLKDVPRGRSQPAPRARWPVSLDTPKDQWVGLYAIPVPDSVDSLPSQGVGQSGLRTELTTWEYGSVAELLHIGPYDREEPTIGKLTQFIADCGYEIVGAHEEEYLRGPGLLSRGNPQKYLTIIRYRVKKTR